MFLSRRKRKRNTSLPEITLTPLIDVCLTLLIIFMITTPMMKDSLKISLPEVKNQGDRVVAQKQLEVYVDKNGTVSVNDKIVKQEDLAKFVERGLKLSPNKVIIVNGDRSVSYNTIIKVLDTINSIEGEKYVALVAKRVA